MSILENLRSNIWMMGARKLLKKVRTFQKNFEEMPLEELGSVFRRWKKENYVTPHNMLKRLPEIFGAAVVLSKKTLFLSPFDVQILAGIAIAEQNFPEMKTGEGKTLVTLLPGVLYYLAGIKVHIMTSNPYLAERDAGKMSPPYEVIGATVSFLKQNMPPADRIAAYGADVTYGQGHQFAFDFLNSYLVNSLDQQIFTLSMLRTTAVITDEGDHVIIEGSTTPMIISGPKDRLDKNYEKLQPFVARLLPEDYHHDKQMQAAYLRLSGWNKLEEQLAMNGLLKGSLADFKNRAMHHAVRNLINANFAQQEGVHYIVVGKDIKLIDLGTGRIADGRRYSEGLHMAIEAKESSRGVEIKPDNRITARVNFARFIKLYRYISAMSGTMKEDRDEFSELFPAHCLMIPTNRPVKRIDHPTVLFNKRIDGMAYAVKIIEERHGKGQPLLICCSSVRDSELLSMELHRSGVAHRLLNAKQDAHEAEIVAEAGELGAVTIGTGMVSRGTDIYLGKNFQLQQKKMQKELGRPLDEEEQRELKLSCDQERAAVMKAGGLFVLIFTLPSAKKIIRQFQGRAGRQGEPGESQLIITLGDPMLYALTKDPINRNAINVYFPPSKQQHSGAQVNNICDEVLGAHAEHRHSAREQAGQYADNNIEQLVTAYGIRDHILNNKNPQYFRKFLVQLPDQTEETTAIINKILKNQGNFSRISTKLLEIFDYEWSELIILRDALMKTSSAGNFAQKSPLDVYKEESKKLFDNFIGEVKNKFSAELPTLEDDTGESGGLFDFSGINPEDLQLDKLAKNMFFNGFSKEKMEQMFDGLLGNIMSDDKAADSEPKDGPVQVKVAGQKDKSAMLVKKNATTKDKLGKIVLAKEAKTTKPIKEAKTTKPIKEAKATKPTKELKTTKPIKEAKATKPTKELKTTKPIKEAKATKPTKELKTTKPIKEAKATKPTKELKTTKPIKEAKATKPTKELKTTKPIKEAKATKPTKELKTTKPIKEAKTTRPIKEAKTTKSVKEAKTTRPKKSN